MIEHRYKFRERLVAAHYPIAVLGSDMAEDEISFKGGAVFSGDCGAVLSNAKKDFYNCLKSFNITQNTDDAIKIHIEITQNNLQDVCGYKGRIVSIQEDISILAFDERGAAQALYDIEDMFIRRKAPYLKKIEFKNKPLFSPRMAHSAYDLDVFPDGYLQNLAREGIDAILVFTKGVNTTPMGYIDYNSLIERAESYGIDVYAYCELSNFTSPEATDAEKIYDEVYGSIFKAHNKLKGMVFVGESIEFPSSDKNTTGRRYNQPPPDNIPSGKPSPGWWPCVDYPLWLNLVKNSIRKEKPDADIVFWTYNWGWAPEEDRIKLIEKLPTDISLLVTFEMFQKYKVKGVTEMVCDYSLAFEGPGDYFKSEAAAAKRCGIKLYSMVNTGGRTWDFGVIPFEPMPQQWIKRFKAITECNNKYGLSGLMEGHHYGYTPSFITKIAHQAFNFHTKPHEEILKEEVEVFSAGQTEKCLKAFNLWSEAIRMYPASNEDQYGVMRISTAYPLVLRSPLNAPKLDNDTVRYQTAITNTNYDSCDEGKYTLHCLRIRKEIKIFMNIISLIEKGIAIFTSINNPTEEILRFINMGKFMVCTFKTNINVKKMFIVRRKLSIARTKGEVKKLLKQAKKLGKNEIANATESIEYVQKDSSLGYEPTMGYACDKAHIEWKLKQVNYMLKEEVGIIEKSLIY